MQGKVQQQQATKYSIQDGSKHGIGDISYTWTSGFLSLVLDGSTS
jgi:hypothetical protein